MRVLEEPLRLDDGPGGSSVGASTIGDAIAHWARLRPGQPALLDLERSVSWAQLHAQVEAIGQQLARMGFTSTARLGLIVPEGLFGGQLIIGLCSHAVLVPINPALTAPELQELVAETRLDALVVPASLRGQVDLGGLGELLTLEAHHEDDEAATPTLRTTGARARPSTRDEQNLAGVMLLLRSSGTTGRPKLVPVTHRNLSAMSAKMASAQWFHLGSGDRAASVLPLYYAAGLKNLLIVPLFLGGSVAFPPPGSAFDIGDWLPKLAPTFFCTTPTTLRAIVERLSRDLRGPSLRFIMCGASYLPDDLCRAAEDAFGVPVLECYGLTEAGVMAANPLQPGRARRGTVGRPLGDDLCVVDAQGRPLPSGEVGEILVRGDCVCPGYLLPDGGLSNGSHGNALLTGDLGMFDSDGFLQIQGRTKEVINRGGEKVFPYEVEKVLLEHVDVLECAVYGVPHPRLGQSVAASAVLKPGRSTPARDITAWLAGRLAPYKIPRRLDLVASLPKGKTGKVQRDVLAGMHREQPAVREDPDSLLQTELLELWRRMLQTREIGLDDDFLDCGGDSLLAADLLLEIERLTGVSTEGWDLSTLTVREVTRALLYASARRPSSDSGLLLQIRDGQGPPLFFCHGDIASRGIYAHRLAESLAVCNPMWLLNYPERYASFCIEDMAAVYLEEMLRLGVVSSSSAVYLAGWCNAGLVIWHLAHLLRERSIPVQGVVLIETPSLNGEGALRRVAQVLRGTGAARVPGRAGRFLREEAMRGLWALRRKGVWGFSAALLRRKRPDIPEGLLRRSVLYYQRMARYVPPPLDVPVTCLLAQQGWRFDTDPHRWRLLAPVVRQVSIPGTHYSAVVSHQGSLAARLTECLEGPSGAPLG